MFMKIIHFSGGKTSAYMTIKYYQEGDLVIFCDTGREHPKTYEFIDNFEKNENIPIIKLKYNNADKPFEAYYQKGKYNNIPNRTMRKCTIELKIKTARRYLVSLGYTKYNQIIGFRYDEDLRVKRYKSDWKKVTTNFPLYDDKIDKYLVNKFWDNKNYNLEIPSILGNCDLCFMKGKNAILSILAVYPELADKWIEDEENSIKLYGKSNKRTYFPDITYRELRDIAQNNLFKEQNLSELQPAFNCSCTA